MARTVEDLIIEIADKHTVDEFPKENNTKYLFLKRVLNDFVKELAKDERCYGDLIKNIIKKNC